MIETLFIAALAVGVAAASLAGPMTLGWSAGPSVLRRRMNALTVLRPGRSARLAGAGVLASLLIGGALAAYAAAPSAPERLPSQVAGVTGSGDALSLQLKDGAASRSLKVGDAYEDGWVVQSISPSEATLAKAGEVRRIGLGPTGALAAAPRAEAPSKVTVAGQLTDEEIIQKALASGDWDGKASVALGLTLEETKRQIVYSSHIDAALAAKQAAAIKQTGKTLDQLQAEGSSLVGIGRDEMLQAVGAADADDFLALGQKGLAFTRQRTEASGDVNAIRALNHQEVIGPDSFYVPAGNSETAAAKAAGLSSVVGYTFGSPDASGGRTLYRTQALYQAAEGK